MNTNIATEILLNAHRVNPYHQVDIYEFVLNDTLHVMECVQVASLTQGLLYPVHHFRTTLQGVLFELNHVRVNPHLNNSYIIDKLTDALAQIGVQVYNTPHQNSMAMCYRPLGEIKESVRFYFNELGHCTFLCPNAKLKAVPRSSHRYR